MTDEPRKLSRNETHDLQTATEELIDGLAKGNPNLMRPARYDRVTIGGRRVTPRLHAVDPREPLELGPQVVSPRTADAVLAMLRAVVTEGTGSLAALPNTPGGRTTGSSSATSSRRWWRTARELSVESPFLSRRQSG